MKKLRTLILRLGGMFNKKRKDDELRDEIESHLQLHIEENLRAGMGPEQARRMAKIKFGGIESTKEAYRDQRGLPLLETLWQDVRYGARMLRKHPGFTIVATLTLALGVGANTAIFSLVYGILFRPLPYRDPDQLVRVFLANTGQPRFPMSPGDFQDYREQNSTLSGLALYTRQDLELTMGDQAELLSGLRITSGFFDVVGVPPLLGREFHREDEAPGNHHVVILSNRLWQRRFHSDSDIIGKQILLTGEAFTVVGVMPPGLQHLGGSYRSMPHGETVDFWWPVTLGPQESRGSHYLNAVGRLKTGVSVSQAVADFQVISKRLAEQFPNTSGFFHIAMESLHEEIVGRVRTTLLVLLGAVLLVLLIACVNIANLLLARSAARQKEMALRAAVGAGRWRIVRQLIVESLLLATLGTLGGILLAQCGIILVGRLELDQLPRLQAVHLDWHILIFALGLTIVNGIIFGLVPTLQAGKTDLNGCLKEGERAGTSNRQRRLQDALVGAEVALALMLLVGTGLLVRSFWKLQQTDAGFIPERVLTGVMSLPYATYDGEGKRGLFQKQLLDRLAALPGVESVGFTSDLPWSGYDENAAFEIENKSFPPDQGAGGRYHFVSSDYFRTVGVPLLAGRFFNADDAPGKRKVILINQALAKRYWPDGDAIGKRIAFSPAPKEEDWRQIVGVVGDVKDFPESPAAAPAFYMSMAQAPVREFTLALRTSANPSAMISSVRREIEMIDKNVPLAQIKTLAMISEKAVAGRRFTFWLVGCFALTALTLASIGIYGVLSYLVAQRTREIGVRMALGAVPSDLIRLTLKQGMRPTLIGMALGLAAAFALTRFMSSLLFEVTATDPATFVVCALLLMIVALFPCWLPARRAAKVDPMVALRYE
jgi:predicted permease